MFNRKDVLYWLSSYADDAHHDHAAVQKDLKDLLHDYAVRSVGLPSQTVATTPSDSTKHSPDDRHHVHDECVAQLLSAQREKDERKWHMRRAVCGHCLVDVKRCPPGSKAVDGGSEGDGSLLKRLQERLRVLEDPSCAIDCIAHYPALQQGQENDQGSVLLVREHLHAAVDLKILFKAHERKELKLPLYLRLQIMWECAQALRALHRVGLGHGDLTLSCIKVKLVTQRSKLDNYMLGYVTGNVPSTFYSPPEASIATTEGKAVPFDAVPAVDVYSFGIICFELLSMTRVCKLFDGTKSDFRKQYTSAPYQPSWQVLDERKEIVGEGRNRFEELIGRCLSAEPRQRPQIQDLCASLEEAILRTILPDEQQRYVWTMAIDMSRKHASREAKGKVIQEPEDQFGSTEDAPTEPESAAGPEADEEADIFRIPWVYLEQALCKVYLGDRYRAHNQQGDLSDQLDTHYDKTKLCLYVIHHLLAEWDMRDILLLTPTQIDQLCRQWKLSRLFPTSASTTESDSFKERFLRKDVLVKRRLSGSVPLFNWIQFNQWFPSPSSDAGAFVANISAIVFHDYFQLVESGMEAKYLLQKSDLPVGTFFVHFSRSFAHRILFSGIDHSELSEPYAVSWIEEGRLKKDSGDNSTVVKTAYFSMEGGKISFESGSYPSLEEWRDHMRSSGRVPLSQAYKPPKKLEFMKLVWRVFKKRMRANRETACSRIGFTSIQKCSTAAGGAARGGEEMCAMLDYIHPEVREMVEDMEVRSAEENPNAAVSTNTIPYKEGIIMRKEKGRWRKIFAKAMDGFLILYEHEAAAQPFEVITLEGTSVEALGPDSILLSSPLQAFINWEFTVPDEVAAADEAEESRLTELQKWGAVMQFWGCRGFLHTAYSPVREQIDCKWYVDGRDSFAAMYHAILNAKHTVFITDWRLTGEVYLMRQNPFEDCHRVDQLLKKKAEQGVKIYILLWRDPSLFTDNGSREVQKLLCQLHENIKILRHPYFKHIPNSSWTHHQKSVVVDYGSKDIMAFVGGIDLTWGRWDTSDHSITDYNRLAQFWPGKDYWNQAEPSFKDPYVDILDRDHDPRMAWHDIHMSVDGEAAIDVAFNFVHRWNHHLTQLPDARQEGLPVLEPLRNPFRREVEVDPNVQYRLVNEKNLRPLAKQRQAEVDAASKAGQRGGYGEGGSDDEGGIVQKLQQRWRTHRQTRTARHRRRRGRVRMLAIRIQGRIVRLAVRFGTGLKKAVGLPLRRFKTKAKIEEQREKERIKRNRVDLMAAITHHTEEEERYKSSLRRKREERMAAKREPTEAKREREADIEKERSEKGTVSLTSSQESNADRLEDDLDRYEHAQHVLAHQSSTSGGGVCDGGGLGVDKNYVDGVDAAVGEDSGAPETKNEVDNGMVKELDYANDEEKKRKRKRKKEKKENKKNKKSRTISKSEAGDSDTESRLSYQPPTTIATTEDTNSASASARGTDTTSRAETASTDKRRLFKRMLSRQQTKMRMWEERERDKWNALRKKWAGKRESQSQTRAQDLRSDALPTRLHDALHQTPPLPYPQTCAEAIRCRCQLLRSIGKWSGGNRLEQSIQEAYVSMIERAKHFIYIENQYFISTVDNHGPCNQIAAALVTRLARAIRDKERFMVILVIPITPSMVSAEDLKTRIITKLQYKTVWDGKRSIFAALHKQLGVGEEEIRKYFRVNALRKYGFILGCPVTNQVYVHAKLMIIDDCEAIIGSANINDRSMEGDKDSELAVWVEDTDTVNGRMAGQDFRVGKFVHSLRMNLWREHLGLQEDVEEVELKDERRRVVGSKHVHHDGEASHKKEKLQRRAAALERIRGWTSTKFASSKAGKKKKEKQERGEENESESERKRESESESDATAKGRRKSTGDEYQVERRATTWKERRERKKEKKRAEKEEREKHKRDTEAREKRIRKDREERETQERKVMKRGQGEDKTDHEQEQKEEAETARLVETICDPLSGEAVQLWDHVAESNTRIFAEVFPFIPQNSIASLSDFAARKTAFEEDKKNWNQQKLDAIRERLGQVRGHLVEYPLRYLSREKMQPNLVSDPVLSVMKQAFW